MKALAYLFLIILPLTLTACGRDLSSTTYNENATVGKVVEGTLISERQITVKANDKLQNNTGGIIAGGAVGAVAGSALGGGIGKTAAALGLGLVGAAAGALIEDKLSTNTAMEYLVKLDSQYVSQPRPYDQNITINNASVTRDIKSSLDTSIISVIQKPDPSVVLNPGMRVYIIYHDDRPRIVPQVPVAVPTAVAIPITPGK